jgi:hypothetical protein
MNTNEGTDVELEEGKQSLETPAKAKRGRPKRADGIKIPRKPKRDIYHEAFGHKLAAVAVAALKRGPDGKAIIAAVKTFSASASKRAKLEAKRAKLVSRNDSILKKVAELDEKLVKFVDAVEIVKGFQGRVLSMIDTIIGKPDPKPEPAAEATA